MRWFETIRKIAAHVCVICSIILLTAWVMDSYNPYMDFTGHSSWAIYALFPVLRYGDRARCGQAEAVKITQAEIL